MTLFVLAYLAGLFTIATPCILPVLPFLLARADTPFRRGGLPMLLGLAIAFAAAASLAAVAGGWAVAAGSYGRDIALALLAVFGLALLFPPLADWLSRPLVAAGATLSQRAAERNTTAASLLLGVATGLVWAPCAGPVLGLILTGAALNGPSAETALLLLTYALGAATSLAAVLLFGRRVVAGAGGGLRWGEGLKRLSGAAVIAGTAAVWSGLDLGLLTRLSSAGTTRIEDCLLTLLRGGNAQAAEAQPVPLTGPLRALLGAQQWLNTQPLQASDLQGKVVLVNFWTYSCINCLRALPYVRAWAETYKDRGLVVVGVHTPEFAFEKDAGNVRKALANLGVKHAVALDNDFGIWRAFSNRGWPALYLLDARGQIQHQVLGEGRYEQTEAKIRELLNEAGNSVAGGKAGVTATSTQVAADERNLRSGETYIGYRQSSGFVSPDSLQEDLPALYRPATSLRTNQWSLDGKWTVGGEYATLNSSDGGITYRFHARDLHLVLAPPSPDRPVRFRVTIDGKAPGADHGFDTDADGWGTLTEDRLYQLVRQSGTVRDRLFEITFAEPGVRAYAFTFG